MARAKKKQEIKVGLNAFGVIRVFVKEKTITVKGKKMDIVEMWTNISRQNEDDSWVNRSFPVVVNKNLEAPKESGLIDVTEGWFFLTGNKGYEKISLYVKDYEEVEDTF